jgi:hypothetical protein
VFNASELFQDLEGFAVSALLEARLSSVTCRQCSFDIACSF